MTISPPPRSRLVYATLLVLTVALGLASRRYSAALPSVVARYAGDTLWAAMVFWLAAVAFPRGRRGYLAGGALLSAIVVELSQLYHAAWLDAIRATRLGALALGQGFLWSDFACYAAGVCAAALLDRGLGAHARASGGSSASTTRQRE